MVAFGATIPAASASRADVATAVASASSGDTVTVPSGAANWTSSVTLPDGVKVVGAGKGNTILTNAGGAGIFQMNDGTWVEGFTMMANGGNTSSYFCNAIGTNLVINLVRFDSATHWNGAAILAILDQQQGVIPNGVMKNCDLIDSRCDIEAPFFNGMHARWAQPTAFGAQDTWYFEDCTFQNINWGQNVIDVNYGGSYVARFCTFTDCFPATHGIQSFNSRGPRKTEFYGNTFTGGVQPASISIGAGTSVIYSNTVSGAGMTGDKARIWLAVARGYEAVGDGGKADGHSNWDGNTPIFSGTHTGANDAATLTDSTKSWTVNQFVVTGWSRWVYNVTDGSKGQCTANTATTFTATLSGGTDNNWDSGDTYSITDGWPARDQPGTGQDASTWASPYLGAAPVQASEPIYIWANTGFETPIVVLNDQGSPQPAQLIQEGRDYIYDVHPTYTALAYPHPLLGESSGSTGVSDVKVTELRIGTIQVAP